MSSQEDGADRRIDRAIAARPPFGMGMEPTYSG